MTIPVAASARCGTRSRLGGRHYYLSLSTSSPTHLTTTTNFTVGQSGSSTPPFQPSPHTPLSPLLGLSFLYLFVTHPLPSFSQTLFPQCHTPFAAHCAWEITSYSSVQTVNVEKSGQDGFFFFSFIVTFPLSPTPPFPSLALPTATLENNFGLVRYDEQTTSSHSSRLVSPAFLFLPSLSPYPIPPTQSLPTKAFENEV